MICESAEKPSQMILCDLCDGGYHMNCTEPRLLEIPQGSCYCRDCSVRNERNGNSGLYSARDVQNL
jgi:hypothetical protein